MDSTAARDGLSASYAHYRDGRLQLATAVARELLASDAADDAASLLLQIRIDQGWFGDAIQLARDRFHVALPAKGLDCAASLRMHVARIFAGANTDDALRALHAVETTVRAAGDLPLVALAAELIAKASVATLQLAGSPYDAAAFDALYRYAAELYDHLHDTRPRLAVLLQYGNALLPRDREAAMRLFGDIATEAAAAGFHALALQACLRLGTFEEVVYPSELLRARTLRQRVADSWARGTLEEETAAEALQIFREEGALLDVVGFSADLSENAFRLGHFAAAAAAARESLEAAQAMPFPYGDANARVMLGAALHHTGRFLDSAAQSERILALPARYRRKRHLDVLPSIGFLLQVKQGERARRLAADHVADIESDPPTPELSIALHYLANVNVALRQWPEVFAALERSIAVEVGLGNHTGAALKRIELASWRVKAEWLKGQRPPAEIVEAAMLVFQAEERGANALEGPKADEVRMHVHQARAMALQAAGAAAEALDALERFGDLARRLGSHVHQTNYHTQAGLILHDLGRHGDTTAARAAQPHLEEAFARAVRTGASDTIANAAYLAAANERVLARFASDADAADAHLTNALALLEEADRHIARLQMQYTEPGSEKSQLARMAIHGQWKKVYDIAVELLLFDTGEAAEAYSWIEKWKGRALCVTLGLRPLPTPADVPADLLAEEAQAIAALETADCFETLAATRDRLQNVWDRLAAVPAAAEYMSLRTGSPVTFEQLVALLAEEERAMAQTQSPTSTNGDQ